jgi:hypothetical protein
LQIYRCHFEYLNDQQGDQLQLHGVRLSTEAVLVFAQVANEGKAEDKANCFNHSNYAKIDGAHDLDERL